MTTIDPTTPLGVLRLRVADFGDIPFLPDTVYLQTLVDQNNSLTNSARICASYILGMLAFKTDRKLGLQLSVSGSQAFRQYKEFLILTVKDPAFMDLTPIPFNEFGTTQHPIIVFQKNWNLNIANTTVDQELQWNSIGSPPATDGFYEWYS